MNEKAKERAGAYGFGHVPEENLDRYRRLMNLSRRFKSLGDTIGANDPGDSTACWRMADKYKRKAGALRVVPGPGAE